MNVTLIGMGSGQPENLTLQGLAALRQADLILGARRLLAVLPAGCTENRAAAYRPDEVAELLQTSGAENAVLVYSGDTGFYSGASAMMEKLEALGVRAPGLPDEAFERGDVPMTKQEVRAAVLAKLAVRPEDILWDVGAGTGSVSVELALAAPRGRVYAVECRPEGCALIKANREKFRTRNLVLVEGLAPAALSDLPAPDAVFIGGSKGSLAAIVDAALDKNPDARICVSAIALESLSAAVAALTAKGRTVQVSQIAVSRARAVGGLHLMMAQNPIYLITGE